MDTNRMALIGRDPIIHMGAKGEGLAVAFACRLDFHRHEGGVLAADWPEVIADALHRDEIQMALQVNGKVRDQISVPSAASKEEIEKLALENPAVLKWTEGKTIRKVIVVPGRLVNIAVS